MTDIIEQIIYDIELEIGISGLESYVCKDGTEIKTDVGAVYDWFSDGRRKIRMTKLQEYLEMRDRHVKDMNNFPIAFAFNEKQLNEALEKLSVKSIDECCTVHNCGDIIRKRDFKAYKDMVINHAKELNEAMKDPEFAKSAFRYEMDNREYAINWDGDSDVLSCFGWDPDTFSKVHTEIQNAYLDARKEHMEYYINLKDI